jgi:hypothetical protein
MKALTKRVASPRTAWTDDRLRSSRSVSLFVVSRESDSRREFLILSIVPILSCFSPQFIQPIHTP